MSANQTLIEKKILERYGRISLIDKFLTWRRLKIIPFWELEKLTPKNGKVVDLGCGQGIFACLLALNSAKREIVGIDLAADRLRIARQALSGLKNITFVYGDICQMKNRAADCFIINEVLYLIPFENQIKLLKSCARNIKSGGLLIIKFFNLKNSVLFPRWKYFLALSQTKIIHWLYRFLVKFNFLREKIMGLLGKRKNGPFFWEEDKIEMVLSDLGFKVTKKALAPGKLFPHLVFVCLKK